MGSSPPWKTPEEAPTSRVQDCNPCPRFAGSNAPLSPIGVSLHLLLVPKQSTVRIGRLPSTIVLRISSERYRDEVLSVVVFERLKPSLKM